LSRGFCEDGLCLHAACIREYERTQVSSDSIKSVSRVSFHADPAKVFADAESKGPIAIKDENDKACCVIIVPKLLPKGQSLAVARAAKEKAKKIFSDIESIVGIGLQRVGDGYGIKMNLSEAIDEPMPTFIYDTPIEYYVVGRISASDDADDPFFDEGLHLAQNPEPLVNAAIKETLSSPIECEHANEVRRCNCSDGCYCKGRTCKI
jgi:hypothetical protein